MISVLIPCFNECEVLPLTYQAVVEAARDWGEPIELILVDDGSRDGTWETICELARADPRVRGVRLSRNFGHQAALGAGLEHASGQAVVVLDADLQDPPSLVSQMLALWRQGYDVVYGQRNCRQGESWFKKLAGHLFYRVLDKFNEVSIPRDTGDFALLDAAIVRQLLQFREHGLFWRGLRCWAGFKHTAVHFDRPPRARGQTKYSLHKLLQLAFNGLLSFSPLPLRAILYAGGLAAAVTGLVSALCLAHWLVRGTPWLISPEALGLFWLGAVQLLSLGLVGEYLYRVYDEVRDRPRWIVQEAVNLQTGAARESYPKRRAA